MQYLDLSIWDLSLASGRDDLIADDGSKQVCCCELEDELDIKLVLSENDAEAAKAAAWWTGAGGEAQGPVFAEHHLKLLKA